MSSVFFAPLGQYHTARVIQSSSAQAPRSTISIADYDMTESLEAEFDAAMMDIYHRARAEAKYNASRYLQMLNENRGLRTAQTLLSAQTVSEGYTALWERKRLDLTVEALILQPRWNDLFTDEDRAIARNRLNKYSYQTESKSTPTQT